MDGSPPRTHSITAADVIVIEERAAQATAYAVHAQQVCVRLRQEADKLLRAANAPAAKQRHIEA